MPELMATSVALAFAWLFALAGLHKLRSTAWYAALLHTWLTPAVPATLLTRLLGLIELAAALVTLLPATRSTGLLVVAAMLLGYTAIMGWQLGCGKVDLRCGCAGPASDTRISAALIYRNLVCAGLAAAAASSTFVAAGGAAMLVANCLLAVFLVLLYEGSAQLISNAQQFAGVS